MNVSVDLVIVVFGMGTAAVLLCGAFAWLLIPTHLKEREK